MAGAVKPGRRSIGPRTKSYSAATHDYPPPPDVLADWIAAWGEFTMLPFLKIPPEQYRLFLAVIMLPLALTIWMLKSATARLLGHTFCLRAGFDQFLKLLAYPYITFWLLSAFADLVYSGLLGAYALDDIRGDDGPLAQSFYQNFMPMVYTILFGLIGVYNAVAARSGVYLRRVHAILAGGPDLHADVCLADAAGFNAGQVTESASGRGL